jgi:hypothetical protein
MICFTFTAVKLRLFWWGDLREGDHLGDLSIDGRIILKMDLQQVG